MAGTTVTLVLWTAVSAVFVATSDNRLDAMAAVAGGMNVGFAIARLMCLHFHGGE
jgi:hypothetical protein